MQSHAAMLNGEDRHQQEIDQQRLGKRRDCTGIDRFRYDVLRDEANGIEKGAEEDEISGSAVASAFVRRVVVRMSTPVTRFISVIESWGKLIAECALRGC